MKQKSILFLLLAASQLSADPVLTFFFKPFPQEHLVQRTLNGLKKSHGVSKRSLLSLGSANQIAGIFSTYYGFINVSDAMGQTSFPRKQSKGTLTVIATQKISPIMMFNNTVSHWEAVPGSEIAAYSFSLQEDPETKLSLWQVSEGTIPEDGQLKPTDSLIIIVKPKNLYIPLGATLAHPDANLKLPDMYIKQGIKTV